MLQHIFLIVGLVAGLITIFWGTVKFFKNKEWIKNTLAECTRRGIKVIYVLVGSHNDLGTTSLHLYLCGEETSWLFVLPSEIRATV